MNRALIVAVLAILWSAQAAIAGGEGNIIQGPNRYSPPAAKDGFQYPDCFCTDSKGQRVEMGQTSCLKIGSTQVLARCSMSLNNPTWRRLSEGCPTS